MTQTTSGSLTASYIYTIACLETENSHDLREGSTGSVVFTFPDTDFFSQLVCLCLLPVVVFVCVHVHLAHSVSLSHFICPFPFLKRKIQRQLSSL